MGALPARLRNAPTRRCVPRVASQIGWVVALRRRERTCAGAVPAIRGSRGRVSAIERMEGFVAQSGARRVRGAARAAAAPTGETARSIAPFAAAPRSSGEHRRPEFLPPCTLPCLSVLGGVRVQGPSGVVQLHGQRARVLSCLAIAGAAVTTEELAEELWGETRPRNWRGALRVALYETRSALEEAGVGAKAIARSGPLLWLDAGAVNLQVDLWHARTRARAARAELEHHRPEQAATLADEAEELFVRHDLSAPAASGPRSSARLRVERVENLELLARAALAAGRLPRALAAAEAALALDPTNQPACLLGMRAAEALHDTPRGLGLYTRLRGALARTLGISPDPALATIYTRLVGTAPPRAQSMAPVPTALRHTGPFVGRDAELARLYALWGRVERGEAGVAAISGPAGVGKTALVAVLAGTIARRGGLVLYGREADPPRRDLDALAQVLEGYLAAAAQTNSPALLGPLEVELRLLLDDRATERPLGPRARRARLAQAVRAWWALLAEQRPTMIALDDLQWAGPTLRSLLAELAVEGVPEGLLLLGSARDADGHAPAGLQALLAHRVGTEIHLGPLGIQDAALLLEPVDTYTPHELQEIWLLAEGNPERLLELARLRRSRDALDSASVSRAAFAAAGAHARSVAAAVAVLGRASSWELVAQVAEVSDPTAPFAAAHAGLLRIEPGGLLHPPHDLLREDILAALPASERIALHARAARALSGVQGSQTSVARHLERSGFLADPEMRARAHLAAARQAIHCAAYEGALAELRALAQLPLSADRTRAIEATWLGAQCLAAIGDPGVIDAVCELLEATINHGAPDPTWAARAAELATSALIPTVVGRTQGRLVELLTTSLARARQPIHIAQIASALALAQVWTAPAAVRRRLARRAAAALGRAAGDDIDDRVRIATLTRAHLGSLEAAHPAARLESGRALVRLATSAQDVEGLARAHLLVHDALVELGRLDQADAELQAARLCAGLLDDQVRWEVAIRTAGRLIMAGDLARAEEAAERALETPRAPALREGAAAAYGAHLLQIRAAQGRLSELADVFGVMRSPQEQWPVWDAAEARVRIATGELDRARELLVRGTAQLLDPSATDITWLARAVQLGWVAVELGDQTAAASLAQLLRPYRGTLHWSVCLSLGPIDLLLALLTLRSAPRAARSALARARRLVDLPGCALWHADLERLG